MTSRRNFIKTVTMSTVALSTPISVNALTSFQTRTSGNDPTDENKKASAHSSGNWDFSFEEKESRIIISNHDVEMEFKISFICGEDIWKVADSRDGVPDRYCLVDTKGNVQGYWVVNTDGRRIEILFFHRSAQNFGGRWSLDGKVKFAQDSFACRTIAAKDERVLNLFCGTSDNAHNDSIFAPISDSLLKFKADSLEINACGNGQYHVKMSGRIDAAAEAGLAISLTDKYFTNRYMPYYKAISLKGEHKVPTGWMSWNTYFDTATAKDNIDEARIGKKYLQDFGCDIWHIESWQGNSDRLPVSGFYNMNLEVNEKQFPEGMKKLAADIRKLGYIPGIWTAPFGTGSDDFYNEHKDWFLHDKSGKAITSWNGKYTLDPTVLQAREHLKKIHHTAAFEWGYGYFKVDGMSGRNESYSAHLYERPEIRACFHDPSCKNPFELCLRAIREGIGEDSYLLACQGHSTGPEARYADASRLGADIVHPNCLVVWEGVQNQARCFLNQAYAHNIVMICDPDTLLVRDLDIEQARVSATVIALPGQLTFFGDKLKGLDKGKMKILQQTLSAARVRPMSLYPYFDMLPVWNLFVDNGKMPPYNVVALFNWSGDNAPVRTTAEELGIEPLTMETFEFWTGAIGRTDKDGSLSSTVPGHGVRVFSLHKNPGHPFWIGSDRHITMSGTEFSSYNWDGHTLSMDINLVGGFPLKEHFCIPEGFYLGKISCIGAQCTRSSENDRLTLELVSKKTSLVRLEISFD